MRNFIRTFLSFSLLVCVTAVAWSSEADELRAKAKAVQKEAEQLAKDGQSDEAEKHFRAVKELLQAAERHEQKSPKSAAKHVGKQPTKLPEDIEDAARRIKHIHIAIENLHAAGLHDVAEELAKRAETMKHELHQAHERATKELPSPKKELPAFKKEQPSPTKEQASPKKGKQADPVDELRHEIQRLRDELNELRQEVKK